jgi:hypothetical protein
MKVNKGLSAMTATTFQEIGHNPSAACLQSDLARMDHPATLISVVLTS